MDGWRERVGELATRREGARYTGIDAGVLAPGKLADVAVVNLSNVHSRSVRRTVARGDPRLLGTGVGCGHDDRRRAGRLRGGFVRFVDEFFVIEEADSFFPN